MNDDRLIEAVNRSGFPLQIGLEHSIQTKLENQWKVIYSEHSWKNPFDSSSGFIDLIVEDGYRTTVLVVEAKKVVDASWIFLVSEDAQMKRRHAKSWVTYPTYNHFDYAELTAEPNSVESKFCVVDGQDAKSRPMLERLASEVVSSTEGFAAEEKTSLQNTALRMYFSVIVTTATLKVCKTNPANISVATGQVEQAELREVPYLRFRKQLNYNISPNFNYSNGVYADVARQKENTVFVVNSNCFLNFLTEFKVDGSSLNPILRGY